MNLFFPIGVEIETSTVPDTTLPEGWQQSVDGSCGTEFKSGIITKSEHINVPIIDLCDNVLINNGYINEKCGLHVHVGFKHVKDLSAKYRLFRFLCRYEDFFFKLHQPWATRNHFCKRIPAPYWRDMQNGLGFQCWKKLDNDNSNSRYWWVNGKAMERHGTLEFRIMNGSLDAIEIIGWISLLQCVFRSTVQEFIKVDWDKPTDTPLNSFIKDSGITTNEIFSKQAMQFINTKLTQYDNHNSQPHENRTQLVA